MIRFQIIKSLALLGMALAPSPSTAQDPAPPRPPEPVVPAPDPAPVDVAGLLRDTFPLRFDFNGANPYLANFATNHNVLDMIFGLTLAPVDDVLRGQLEIPPKEGVVVVAVKPGGLAEQAGLKPNDVLLSLGDKRIQGVDQATVTLLTLGKGATEVKLIREGKPRRMSLVGPEHGFPPGSSEFWIGVPVSPVDSTLRSHLTALPADAGLIANDVVKGSPADAAGVKKGDILISLGGKPLKNADALIEQVQASGGKPVPLALLRAGKSITLEVTPAKRAHPTAITLSRGQDYQFQVFRPEVGIQVAPGVRGRAMPASPVRVVPGQPGERPIDIQLEVLSSRNKANVEEATARIEAQLKELTAKIEAVRKAVEAMKKPTDQ